MARAARTVVLVGIAALVGSLVASPAVPSRATAAQTASAAASSGADSFELTLDPRWIDRSWTVPETVDGVEVTIAGAPGRGSAGGAGATFTFRTRSLRPGTVLDVLFGAGTDGTFSALDAAPGGVGGSMEESGTAGGNATMLVQRTDSDVCAQSPRNVIAVAGGGGGSSGRQTRSGLFTDSLDLTPPVRGEDSLVWSSGGPSTVRDACRSGMQAKAGEASGTSWYSHLTGGGGGGGGLNSGVGGSAQTASEWTQGNRKNLYGNLPSLVPATGGGAGTSHLAFHSCGNPCSLPAITPNTGPAFVTLRWKQLRDTQVIIRDADGGVLRGKCSRRSGNRLQATCAPTWNSMRVPSPSTWEIASERKSGLRPRGGSRSTSRKSYYPGRRWPCESSSPLTTQACIGRPRAPQKSYRPARRHVSSSSRPWVRMAHTRSSCA